RRLLVVGRWQMERKCGCYPVAAKLVPTTNDQRPTTNDQRPTTNDQRRKKTNDQKRNDPIRGAAARNQCWRAPPDQEGRAAGDLRGVRVFRCQNSARQRERRLQ